MQTHQNIVFGRHILLCGGTRCKTGGTLLVGPTGLVLGIPSSISLIKKALPLLFVNLLLPTDTTKPSEGFLESVLGTLLGL